MHRVQGRAAVWLQFPPVGDPLGARLRLVCAGTGELVDRDVNAAQNLRDWPDHASCGSVGATAPFVLGPSREGTGGGSVAGSPGTGGVDGAPG